MPNRKDFSGKTGTSNDSRDCWFSGLNSNYVTTVWTGFDNQQRNLGRESGATVAQPIWNYFMVPYMKDKPESPVLKPNNVFVHRVDRNTGLFVNQGAGNSRNEFFENDTDPSVKSTGTFNYFNYENASEGENKSTCQIFSKSMLQKQLRGFLNIMDLLKDETKYDTLKSELIIDMTKIYMYADIEKDCQDKFLNIMKPYYKNYKISTRVNTASLPLNLVINIFIKIFSLNNNLAIFIKNLFLKIKK